MLERLVILSTTGLSSLYGQVYDYYVPATDLMYFQGRAAPLRRSETVLAEVTDALVPAKMNNNTYRTGAKAWADRQPSITCCGASLRSSILTVRSCQFYFRVHHNPAILCSIRKAWKSWMELV